VNEDMTGLIYMRGRYYSPAWHRFVSSDQGVDPLSINQFAYVGGMPFMAVDPSGMMLDGLLDALSDSASLDDADVDNWDIWEWLKSLVGLGSKNSGDGGQAKPAWDPSITKTGLVTKADIEMIKKAIDLLNKANLTPEQKAIVEAVKQIHLFNDKSDRSTLAQNAPAFLVNVTEFRGHSDKWNASQIAHDAYHLSRRNNGTNTGTNVFEERLAINFQMEIGRELGMSQRYFDHLLEYRDNDSAIIKRINQPWRR
jgi:RHS repeat-associated protein